MNVDIQKLEHAAEMLKAIAHPMRIVILSLLEDGRKMTVSEIQEQAKLEQSVTSHHLGLLKDKGVLLSKREGRNTYYYLKSTAISNLVECINHCSGCSAAISPVETQQTNPE